MNNAESGEIQPSHTHPAAHDTPNAMPRELPTTSGGSCSEGGCGSTPSLSSSSLSSSSSAPQAEIAFVAPSETTPAIAPVTSEIVAAATAPVSEVVCSGSVNPAITAHEPTHQTTTHQVMGHASVETPAPIAAAPVACEAAQQTVAPTATAVAEHPIAPKPPTLTDAAANDLAAALATAQRARSRAKSNSRGPRPSDLIEKKIVIRRDRWDALIQLTETLRSERAVKAEPSEVAAIVLEAGLGAIVEDARSGSHAAESAAQPAKAVRGASKAKKAAIKAVAPVKTTAPKATRGKGRGKIKARAPKPTRAAPAKPRTFAKDELDTIKKLVRGLGSDRSVQRTLALWLGAHPVKGGLAVPIEDLRSLCREFKVYDTANFAQNMKKDAAYFTEVRDRSGDRLGYSLTPAGVQACAGLFAGAR